MRLRLDIIKPALVLVILLHIAIAISYNNHYHADKVSLIDTPICELHSIPESDRITYIAGKWQLAWDTVKPNDVNDGANTVSDKFRLINKERNNIPDYTKDEILAAGNNSEFITTALAHADNSIWIRYNHNDLSLETSHPEKRIWKTYNYQCMYSIFLCPELPQCRLDFSVIYNSVSW